MQSYCNYKKILGEGLMKRISLIFMLLITTFVGNNYAKNTQKKISILHKKISKDLLSLKKEHPQTQPQVYALLDQVCKIYQLSKKTINKKKELKVKLISVNKNSYILKVENAGLKKELNLLKGKLDSKIKLLENKNKTLAKNTVMLGFVNQEKQKMQNEINRLKEEQKQLILKTQNIDTNKNPNSNKLNNDDQSIKNPLAQLQTVNLTSTWAPSSPL